MRILKVEDLKKSTLYNVHVSFFKYTNVNYLIQYIGNTNIIFNKTLCEILFSICDQSAYLPAGSLRDNCEGGNFENDIARYKNYDGASFYLIFLFNFT